MRRSVLAVLFALAPSVCLAQANGKLQIDFMDVGQGDGAILISPKGETVLFDNGVWKQCDKAMSYLQQLGVTKIDYQVISHLHADHLGCTSQVLHECPLQHDSFDRGGTYHGNAYLAYDATVGSRRRTPHQGDQLVLDQGSPNPVTITLVALNGNGVTTDNENDLSVVAVVKFGNFDAEIGGDLSGFAENDYLDIETGVAPSVGQVEVYKVHHHGSRYSSNEQWLSTLKPRVGVVSSGETNRYGHPTEECMERLHTAGVKTYWTTVGRGVDPEAGMDSVVGNVIVEVDPAHRDTFTVRGTLPESPTDTYAMWEAPSTPPTASTPSPTESTYSWSKRSAVYHYTSCAYVRNISPENLESGTVPPAGKRLHQGCPH